MQHWAGGLSLERPESAWQRRHPRGPSTPTPMRENARIGDPGLVLGRSAPTDSLRIVQFKSFVHPCFIPQKAGRGPSMKVCRKALFVPVAICEQGQVDELRHRGGGLLRNWFLNLIVIRVHAVTAWIAWRILQGQQGVVDALGCGNAVAVHFPGRCSQHAAQKKTVGDPG